MRIPALFLLALLSNPARADIEAEIDTSLGSVSATLDYQNAPRTAANFIGLSEGSLQWLDSNTGTARQSPFFNGLNFYEQINSGSEKLAFAGSRDNSGTDDPGYDFRDEFDPALTHQPYILAMRSNGPNTNGCQFYFTGSIAHPDRDNINTVFGSVSDPASRAIVDAIIASPAGTVTINSIEINRTDPAAVAFDVEAQDLPSVTPLQAPLKVSPGDKVEALFEQVAQTEVRCYQSGDLSSWQFQFKSYLGSSDPAPPASILLQSSTPSQSFYQVSKIAYPDAVTFTSFANRTLTIVSPAAASLIFQFDATGQGGTYQNVIPDPILGDFVLFQGSFDVRSESPPYYGPYSFRMLLYLYEEELGGAPFLLIQGGYDDAGPGEIQGRQVTRFMGPSMALVFKDKGSLTVSNP